MSIEDTAAYRAREEREIREKARRRAADEARAEAKRAAEELARKPVTAVGVSRGEGPDGGFSGPPDTWPTRAPREYLDYYRQKEAAYQTWRAS